MTSRPRLAAVVVSTALVVAVGALSQVPTTQSEPDEALLRLSWRLQGLAVEECRTLTREELEAIPAHMRRTEECTRQIVDYELRVIGAPWGEVVDTVSPSGARRDRPVYVFRDLPAAPGSYDVEITFSALVPADFESGDQPLTFAWTDLVTLSPAQIVLVTLDDAATSLVRSGQGG